MIDRNGKVVSVEAL